MKALNLQQIGTVAAALALAGCTGQIPGSFRFLQQVETFKTTQQVNTKVDLLWVVDNSASMDVSQEKLRLGFESFSTRYMKPTWDIRLAVITTDTYMADPVFDTYRNTVITSPNTVGATSAYISSRLGTWVNPAWNPTLVNLGTGAFDSGIRFGELVPLWGPNYARLLPGIHDGPITALCVELMPYFMRGVTDCRLRDDPAPAHTGVDRCLNPDTGGGETSVTQCVNTVQNDTVRSGKAILNTKPPVGTPANAAWTQQLVDDAIVNLTTGSAGQGSERGLASVLRLIQDNEGTATAFFRDGSIRALVFVADEDDQTMNPPASIPGGWTPLTDYGCDQAGLLALNAAGTITGVNGYCCTTPGNNCRYGAVSTSCPSKTTEGYTYTPGLCPNPALLRPVSEIKAELDSFMSGLDGGGAAAPNYFVASIVPTRATTIQNLQAARTAMDATLGQIRTHAVEEGTRYLELGALVGNGSLSLDIGEPDYDPVLRQIGDAIVQKTGTFTLDRPPTEEEEMIVTVIHADGSRDVVDPTLYEINGNQLVVTDVDFILTLADTDSMEINYQPATAF
ncbi:MAG: hypothetical protein IT285_11820 [Bdellovibrionales bacterium]|nr:hypothetical protein [Bdellovibrionales bacterium]